MNKYGFIYEQPKQEDYIFGDASISAPILQPDGQWDKYLPADELQYLYGVEPYACATFGTLNAIEILANRLFGFIENRSDRWTAKKTNTEKTRGNSPQVVAEHIRKNGTIDEYQWPILPAINTFELWYSEPPAKLDRDARTFLDQYTFKHDYVPNDPTSMKEALKYSPIGMSVYGWNMGTDGIYQAGNGIDNHWVVCYGYLDGKVWKVFDSYDNTHKLVEWKHQPLTVKRYYLELAPATITWLDKISQLLKEALAIITMKTTSRVPELAKAMQEVEGYAPGTRAYRNNNPLNTRFSRVGYLPKYMPVYEDREGVKLGQKGFAKFKDYDTGFLYAVNLLKEKIRRHPEWTLLQLIGDEKEGWAPASDNNNPRTYATHLAKRLAVDLETFRIKNLV